MCTPYIIFLFSDPGGIRTHDPQLRRLLLYPTELRDHRQPLHRYDKIASRWPNGNCDAKINHLFFISKTKPSFYHIALKQKMSPTVGALL